VLSWIVFFLPVTSDESVGITRTLCAISVNSVSLWWIYQQKIYHGDTEATEDVTEKGIYLFIRQTLTGCKKLKTIHAGNAAARVGC
jgi:hypothetical protein